MAGVKPTFVTGARCKVKVDGKTVAFATNLNYSVEVQHIPVEVLGAYEVIANEPVAYRVSGSFTVVRYTKGPNATAAASDPTTTPGANSPFAMGAGAAGAKAAFNPANLLLSETFDVEVFDRRDGNPANDGVSFSKVRDARMTGRSGGINARGLLEEQINFVGILHDDDIASVARSGANQ